jgi:hypothetical protein
MSFKLKEELHPFLSLTSDGVSEFTFSNLYLFRHRYQYRISREPNGNFIISGLREGKKFFMTPCGAPERPILESLFDSHDYWKNISDTVLNGSRQDFEQWIDIAEDRDNFDYLYFRSDLAELSGKKYHKKRNLVNQFLNAYKHEECPLTGELIPQAVEVLDRWKEEKGEDGDYIAAREALDLFGSLKLRGSLFYVNGTPAGWCLGESVAKGRIFAIHFEKGFDEYKGLYQYMNQAFAASLPRFFTYINREQDLGDEGLRQAKMTYRPSGFVKKHTGRLRKN